MKRGGGAGRDRRGAGAGGGTGGARGRDRRGGAIGVGGCPYVPRQAAAGSRGL